MKRLPRKANKWLAVTMLLMMLLTGMFPGLATGNGDSQENNPVVVETQGGTITLDKTAQVATGCRVFEVTLTVKGEQKDPKPVDVILVIDRSISMQDEPLQQTKNAAKAIVEEILKDGNSGNRVGVVSYATIASLNVGLTSNKDSVINAINNLSASYSNSNQGYTNIAEGFRVAADNMDTSKPLEQRAIILLSDGAANRGPGTNSNPGTIWPTQHNTHTKGAIEAGKAAQQKAKVFTVGLFGEVPQTSLNICRETLQDAQNGGYYETLNELDDIQDSLTEIYNTIWQNITAVATGAVVTDTVADGFRIVENSVSAYPDNVTVNYENNTIVWDIGDIGDITATLTYQVKATSDNAGGENMAVNDSAVLEYYEVDDETQQNVKSAEFPVPTVYVPPKLVVDAGQDRTISPNQSVTLGGNPTASGGYGNYSYLWEKVLGENDYEVVSYLANPEVTPLETTTYKVTVTDFYGGETPACVKSKTVTITVLDVPPEPETVTLTVYKVIEGNGYDPTLLFNISVVSDELETSVDGKVSVNAPATFELEPGPYLLFENGPLPPNYELVGFEYEDGEEIIEGEFLEFFLEDDMTLYVVNRYSAPPTPPPPPPSSGEVILRVEKNIVDSEGRSLNNVSPHNSQTFEVYINGILYSFSVNNPVVLSGYEEGSTFTIRENRAMADNYEYVDGDTEVTIDSGTRTVTITNRYVEPTPPPPSPPPAPEPTPEPPVEETVEEVPPETPQVPEVEVTPEPPAVPEEPEVIEEVPELPKTSALDLIYLGLGAVIVSAAAIRRRRK